MDEKLSCIQYSEAAVLTVAPLIAGVAHEDGSDGGEVSHSREDGGMADDAAQVSWKETAPSIHALPRYIFL